MTVFTLLKCICTHPMNRKHKTRAVIRFFGWQIKSRIVRRGIVVPWVNDSRLMVRKGMTGATGNIYNGLHEYADMGFLLHLLRPSDLFLDVGSNVGVYTVLASSAIGSHSIAIEPVPAAFESLNDNITLNTTSALVELHNIGVGAKEGTLTFTAGHDTMNHVVTEASETQEVLSVPVDTLDHVLAGRCPTLMKIDVEGFETPVLEGAEGLLDQPSLQAIIMELNGMGARYGFDDEVLNQRVLDHGFTACSYDPVSRELKVCQGIDHEGGNMIYVRDVEAVRERLRTAPKFKVAGYLL